MLHLRPVAPLKHLMCIGAHSDDIEIGCGGTVVRLLEEHPGLAVTWVVLSAEAGRAEEARASAEQLVLSAGSAEIIVEKFPERYFPSALAEIKQFFDTLGARLSPGLVLTHRREDAHQDHRTVAELTWNTFRDQLILEYEIPKWEGDLGRPNVLVPLSQSACERKVDTLMQYFPSQRDRHWFTPETFWALLRLRGVEARSPSGYAEGFHGYKVVF